MITFENATLITPQDVIPGERLIFDKDRIVALGQGSAVSQPPGGRKVDLSGLILAPGFIDIQINGAFGLDFTEAPDALPACRSLA
jgi:N-acetylglucosamine-6-phosphate deacetylase